MNETQKTQLKKTLFNNNKINFIYDSLNQEVINLEFQLIDNNIFNKLRLLQNCKTLNNNTLKKSIKNINSYSYEDILINRLNSGNKINLGGF